jgi:DNA-directed RNA polymerase specialized sigma24 family protein
VPLDPDDISRLFARRTYDPEAAVDLVAETFATAFEARRTFRGQGDDAAIGWIYGIARHQLSAFYRRGGVERWPGWPRRAGASRQRWASCLQSTRNVLRLRVVDELG